MYEKKLLGQQIKNLRKRLGLTQDQLSEDLTISPQYLSNIERGLENPTLDVLLRLAHQLKVDPNEMFAGATLSDRALRKKIDGLVNKANGDQLRLIVRMLEAVLH